MYAVNKTNIVNEILTRKPKKRVDWVQKRLREELTSPANRDVLYEVLTRKDGRAFALDMSGSDAMRVHAAITSALGSFTLRQQRQLSESYVFRQCQGLRKKAGSEDIFVNTPSPARPAPKRSQEESTGAADARPGPWQVAQPDKPRSRPRRAPSPPSPSGPSSDSDLVAPPLTSPPRAKRPAQLLETAVISPARVCSRPVLPVRHVSPVRRPSEIQGADTMPLPRARVGSSPLRPVLAETPVVPEAAPDMAPHPHTNSKEDATVVDAVDTLADSEASWKSLLEQKQKELLKLQFAQRQQELQQLQCKLSKQLVAARVRGASCAAGRQVAGRRRPTDLQPSERPVKRSVGGNLVLQRQLPPKSMVETVRLAAKLHAERLEEKRQQLKEIIEKRAVCSRCMPVGIEHVQSRATDRKSVV